MALAVASDRALATITMDKRSVFIKRANKVIPSEPHGKNTTFVFIYFSSLQLLLVALVKEAP
jgi:hypothetical protein